LQAGQVVQDNRLGAVEAVNSTQSTQIGALQTVQAATTATVAQHTTQLAQHSSAIGNLANQVGALQAANTQLFDLVNHDRREARRGIAAAIAMSDAPVPSAPGKTSYVFNLATFRGEGAVGLSLAHRLNLDTPVAITFGFSQSGGKNTAVRVGVAGEF
jgi:autotransporter adhesin